MFTLAPPQTCADVAGDAMCVGEREHQRSDISLCPTPTQQQTPLARKTRARRRTGGRAPTRHGIFPCLAKEILEVD